MSLLIAWTKMFNENWLDIIGIKFSFTIFTSPAALIKEVIDVYEADLDIEMLESDLGISKEEFKKLGGNEIYDEGNLMKFQEIVANPPSSLKKWADGFAGDSEENFKMAAELDSHRRFEWGLPPAGRGDLEFVQHMLASLEKGGTMATILPYGVLFREAV